MKNSTNTTIILLIMFLCFFIFFINNEMIIPDIMESRNMVTANEMVYDGNWLVPTMNGEYRFEKPPLPTWFAACSEMISPANLGLQRAMSGFAAVLLTIFYYFLGLQILRYKKFALISTLIFITCFNVFMVGRTASWDIYCHAFMLGAIYFLFKAFNEKKSLMMFLWAGIFMGLSFMSKGPVSFYALLIPFLISFIIIYRPRIQKKWIGLLSLIIVCIIVGGWWYAFIYLFHGEEMQYVINKESGAWINRSVRPWYYYWKFFLETGIWSILMLTALFLPAWSKSVRKRKPFLFTYIWMFAILFLLSCLPEKKTRYLFPILIPSCYVMGYLIVYWYNKFKTHSGSKIDYILFRINAWMLAIVIALIPIGGFIFLYKDNHVSLITLIILTILIEIIALYIMRCAIRLYPMKMIGGIVSLFIIVACFILPLLKNIVNNPDINSISQVRKMSNIKDIPFYYDDKEELRIELVYAAGRIIRPIDMSNEDSIVQNLPMVVLTSTSIDDLLPKDIYNKIDTTNIGVFDDNRWSKKDKRYRPIFIRRATLLTKK